MKRTQIYIDEEIFGLLKKESKIENKTISELIRESIRDKYKNRKNDIIIKMNSVFGLWKDKKINVDEYIRNLRKNREL
ncbi:unnamed protein product [marine sediment metagenome]|uniref:Ribbon-helix-helix protein CopG domain-containing protein n=1 Tax=marine sediment metagenome TaxID=412755 RepID=X1FQ72_9ZZZZ